MTFGDAVSPEVPPRARGAMSMCPRPRRPFPWRVVSSLVALGVGAGLCIAGKDEAGMLVLGSALIGLGAPTFARAAKGS